MGGVEALLVLFGVLLAAGMVGPVGVGVPGAFAVLLERLVVGALAVLEAMVVVLVERV